MAERAQDADGVECFVDEDGNYGAYDEDDNWIGYVPEEDGVTCYFVGIGGGTKTFICNFT